jgi:hypothetical protein
MRRISDFQVVKLRKGQYVLQFVVRNKDGDKSIQRVFASSKVDAISQNIELDGYGYGSGYANGW